LEDFKREAVQKPKSSFKAIEVKVLESNLEDADGRFRVLVLGLGDGFAVRNRRDAFVFFLKNRMKRFLVHLPFELLVLIILLHLQVHSG